jgi:hypothetical protein
MGRGVVARNRGVTASSDNLTILNYYSADGNFAAPSRLLREHECLSHKYLITE